MQSIVWAKIFLIYNFICLYLVFAAAAPVLARQGCSSPWLLLLRSTALGMQASVVTARGLSQCGPWAGLPCAMWDLPGLRIEPCPLH